MDVAGQEDSPAGRDGPSGSAARPGADDDAVPRRPGSGRRSSEDEIAVPVTAEGRAGLAALLANPGRALIAVDFDGTLAPIVPDPAQARVLPQALAALRDLGPIVGTVAVITGRPALRAVEYGSLDQIPGIIVLGHYGRQRWRDGDLASPPPPPGLALARERMPAVLAGAGAPGGTWVEDKGDALAVHTRRTADPDAAMEIVRESLERLARATGLQAESGRMVIELRPPGADKGQALKDLAAQRPRSAIMFCGDDLGDRPAFGAIREMRAAGQPGVAVCAGSPEVAGLPGEADLVVDGPYGVAALLSALAGRIRHAGSPR